MLSDSHSPSWISIGAAHNHTVACAACHELVTLTVPPYDHHPSCCPFCQAECVYFEFQDHLVQVVITSAPAALVRLIRILQRDFDELEFVELIVGFEEIAVAMNVKSQPGARQ
jgi:hypothetical protein